MMAVALKECVRCKKSYNIETFQKYEYAGDGRLRICTACACGPHPRSARNIRCDLCKLIKYDFQIGEREERGKMVMVCFHCDADKSFKAFKKNLEKKGIKCDACDVLLPIKNFSEKSTGIGGYESICNKCKKGSLYHYVRENNRPATIPRR